MPGVAGPRPAAPRQSRYQRLGPSHRSAAPPTLRGVRSIRSTP
ncbi:hypothetical protein [Microbacterium sp. AG1240]|nr:hypothetical protein [Microbacterium sp. AG1240]